MARAINKSSEQVISSKVYTCYRCGSVGKGDTHRCISVAGPTGSITVKRKCGDCFNRENK